MADVTLVIDAATAAGTVAVLRGEAVAATREVAMRGVHEERLMPAVAEALDAAGATPRALARVVCGAGPGSFTSLRIAAAIAKGLAVAAPVPLYAVSSLALAAADAGPGRWLVVLDALRGDVFAAGYAVSGSAAVTIHAPAVLPADAVTALAASLDAAPRVAVPHARGARTLLSQILSGPPVDLGTWEPAYGRPAEAQARWEAEHGRPLGSL